MANFTTLVSKCAAHLHGDSAACLARARESEATVKGSWTLKFQKLQLIKMSLNVKLSPGGLDYPRWPTRGLRLRCPASKCPSLIRDHACRQARAAHQLASMHSVSLFSRLTGAGSWCLTLQACSAAPASHPGFGGPRGEGIGSARP